MDHLKNLTSTAHVKHFLETQYNLYYLIDILYSTSIGQMG